MKPVITSKSTWPKNSYHHWTHFEQSLSMKKADGSIVVSLLDPEIGLQDRHSTRPSRSITQAPFAYPAMDDLLLPDINAFLEECDCSPQPPPTKDSPSRPSASRPTASPPSSVPLPLPQAKRPRVSTEPNDTPPPSVSNLPKNPSTISGQRPPDVQGPSPAQRPSPAQKPPPVQRPPPVQKPSSVQEPPQKQVPPPPADPPTAAINIPSGETGDTLHNSILQLDLLTLISYMLTKSGYPVSDNFGSDLNRSLDAALEVAARLPTSASAVFSASGPRT